MIDWRVILGALGSGITIALWLETRSLAVKKTRVAHDVGNGRIKQRSVCLGGC